ncbi:MAG: C40 family peptidase [Rhodobacteraceae bacterium]|nr:C40 family peptidase [Paracoccaceae bacterium]
MGQNSDEEPCVKGERIVTLARQWLGTPYRHQASCRGVGTDCLGLLRGLWREAIGPEPEAVPSYTPDWSEAGGEEELLAAATRNMTQVPSGGALIGDVVVMRMKDGGVAKHIGILARSNDGYETLIHAYSGHGVVESPLTPTWSERIAGIFRFPDRSF